MSTQHSLTKTALTYWHEYAFAGLGMVTMFLIFSIPTAAIVWTAYPAAGPLFVLTVFSLSVHMGAAFVRDVQTGEYEPGENRDFVLKHVLLVTGTLLVYVNLLVMTGAIGGWYVGNIVNAPFAGLLVALYYPVADYELHRRGIPSPAVLPLLGLFGLLHAIGLCRDISPQQVIQHFRRRPPMLRMP